MADRVITADAVITAKDGTGDTFTRIAAKFQALGKGAKVSPDLEKLVGTLERAQSQLRALEKTEGARAKFADARARFNAQKAAVESAAKAMAAAEKPTRELEAAYKRAQSAVSKTAAEFKKSKTAFLDAKHAAEEFGTPLAKMAADQARLKSVIESTTQAIERQGAAEVRAAEDAAKVANVQQMVERAMQRRAHEVARLRAAEDREEEHRKHEIAHHGIVNYALGSAAMAVSAHGIAHVSEQAIEAGAELQHERVASANAGRTPAAIAAYTEAAKKTALAAPTASYTESMKTLLETTSAFGSVEHAIDHLTFMMKTAAVLKAASGGKITESAGDMGQQFAKFFEMRGIANDPKRFEAEGKEMVRAMAFTGGTFNPREMFNFASQAKSALRNYDVDYLSRVVPSLVGETGGERAGTAANAFYNVIMGKARDAKQAEIWMKAGLLDPKKVEMKKGRVVSWSAGAVKGTDLAMSNPLRWFEEVELPALRDKLKVDVDNTAELSKTHAQMYRNSMSNQFANENSILADRTRLHKDAGLIDKTEDPDAMYERNLRDDPTQAVTALTASLNSLAAAVTSPAMKSASGVITSLSFGLTKLSAAAMDHPMAAMTAGGVAGAAALGGAGYLSYQMMNGFGLGSSATALDGSAAALTNAAAAIEAASGRSAVGGAAAGAAGAAEAGAGAGILGSSLKGAAGGLLKTGVRLVPEFLAWQAGKQAIDTGLDLLPHPAYPAGYDPKAKRDEGPISRVMDIAHDIGPALQSLARIVQSANSFKQTGGIGAPPQPIYGGLAAAKASFEQPHPALAGPAGSLAEALKGQITAVVDKPVDVTGKVQLQGQANVTVAVKVTGPGEVTGQYASSSGNIKVSTGASMPGAKTAAAGSAGTK